MKKVTTSAQKTIGLDKTAALKKLADKVASDQKIKFEATKNSSIYKAKMEDSSELIVASFEKEDGRTIAMIDHKNIVEDQRKTKQKYWRNLLDNLFR